MSLLLAYQSAPPAPTFVAAWAVEVTALPLWLMRKNVASQVVSGQLVSKTDGSAVTTGTTTVYVTGDGGTQAAGAGTVTHEGQGCWSYVPTQAETNYAHVTFTFTNTSAVPTTVNVYPVSYDPGNATSLGLSTLDAAISTRMATYTQPAGFLAAVFPASVGTSTYSGGAVASVTGNIGGNVVGSVASVVADVGITQVGADKVWGSTTRTLSSYGTLVADVASAVWAAATRTLTAISDSSGVTTLLSRITAGRATGLDNLDATVSSRLATAGYTAPDNATIASIHAKTTNLPADPADASDVLAAVSAVPDLVWDEPLAGHVAAGSAGLALSSATAPTAGAVADAVWDEAIAGHLTAGSTGAALNGAGSAGDPWGTALPGAYGAGTAGKLVSDMLNATVGSRATPADITSATASLATSAALTAATAPLATAAGLTAAVAPLATSADVEVVTDTLGATDGSTVVDDVAAISSTPPSRRR